MLQTLSKKIIICLTSLLILVTCTSCKTDEHYQIKEYLNYVAYKSGISDSSNTDEFFNCLKDWKVVTSDDHIYLDNDLNYAFLSRTITNLIDENGNPLDILKTKKWINNNAKENQHVDKETAIKVVDNAVELINNRTFSSTFEYEYINEPKTNTEELNDNDIFFDEETGSYKVVVNEEDNEYRDAQFDEVFSYFDISDSYEIDFSQAEIIPLQEEANSSYINNRFNLLANKNHVFNKDGFKISYTINSSGLDVHVSKDVDFATIYADASINSIKPNFKWTYDKGDLKNCYFNLKMNTTTSLGATKGKYGNYYLKFKDLDSSSFMALVKSMIVPKKNEVEATIPICQIKTPIPNVPLAYVNMTIGIKLYVSGKVELIIYNAHNIGFEVKDGNSRFFYEHNDDLDTIAKASAKAALALNLGIDATNFRLCDIELDGGIKAELKTTVHLYDSDFNETASETDIAYSTIEEISKDNPYVKVCGDVSLYWLVDLICNTSKSVMYKMGFTHTYHILDDNDQVFGNLHHIEDGKFVKACTRKNKVAITNETINIQTSNKIVLNSYAEVLLQGETFKIELVSLPSGYTTNDIKYSSSDDSVASISGGIISALKTGSSKIKVYTSDNKYSSYINILVSTG